jgi:hypothetical protein
LFLFSQLFDGWELNREMFPAEEDHPLPMRRRFIETCSEAPAMFAGGNAAGGAPPKRKSLMTNQNAAMAQFRVPQRSRGFSITVRFPRNPAREYTTKHQICILHDLFYI